LNEQDGELFRDEERDCG